MLWCLKRCHVIVGVDIRQWLQLKMYNDFKIPCEPTPTFQRSLLPKLLDHFKHKLLIQRTEKKNHLLRRNTYKNYIISL